MKKIFMALASAVLLFGLSCGVSLADGIQEALAKYGQENVIAAFQQMAADPQNVNPEQAEIILFSIDKELAATMLPDMIKPLGPSMTPAAAKPLLLQGVDGFRNAQLMRPIFEKIFALTGN